MRYGGWFGRKGMPNPTVAASDVAKKLLGRLANRRALGGPSTLVERMALDDGSIVEARFSGDIPTVRILRKVGSTEYPICELYVESGLLDLGPNIAADAAQRFNRGPPEFDDSPATLHFGTGVTCADGLNGGVMLTSRGFRSRCLGSTGQTAQSRLFEPAKKRAQAMLPASCWSGLMHRYVAAIYGSTTVDYAEAAGALVVKLDDREASLSPYAPQTWGLVRSGTNLAFVVVSASQVEFRELVFAECHAKVLEIWKRRYAGDSALGRKVLSIALSGCVPGDVVATYARPPVANEVTGTFGYAFDEARAMQVFRRIANAGNTVAAYPETVIEELSFSVNDDGVWSVASDLLDGGWKKAPAHNLVFRDGSSTFQCPSTLGGVSYADVQQGLDAPIYAYYVDGRRRVFRVAAIAQGALPPVDTLSCFSVDPTNTIACPSSSDVNCSIIPMGGTFQFDGNNGYVSSVGVAYGLYSTIDGSVDWSDVEVTQQFVRHRPNGVIENRPSEDASVLLRTVDKVPFLTRSEEESAIPENPSDNCFDIESRPAINPPGGAFNVMWYGCGVTFSAARPECTEAVADASLYSISIGDGYLYVDFAYTTRVHRTLAVAGRLSRRRNHLLAAARGNRCAGIAMRVATKGAFGMIVRTPRPSSDTTCTATRRCVSNGSGNPVSFVDTGGGPIGAYVEDTAGAHPSITPTPLGLPSTVPVYYDWQRRSLKGGVLEPGRVDLGLWTAQVKNRGGGNEMRGTQEFQGHAFVAGATVAYDPQAGSLLNDPDVDVLGPEVPMVEYACKYLVEDVVTAPAAHVPLDVETSGGGSNLNHLLNASASNLLPSGATPNFESVAGMLDGGVVPIVSLQVGASINMDRQTITGGYPKVSTPSFVGWA